jgi:hypothetical protein
LFGLPPRGAAAATAAQRGQAVITLGNRSEGKRLALKETEWTDVSKEALQQGDVRIRLTAVRVRVVERSGAGGNTPPTERELVIGLRVTNVGVVREVDLVGWPQTTGEGPRLTDNFGNVYAQKVSTVSAMAARARRLPPGKYADEQLVFQVPAVKVQFLRLELPASAFDETASRDASARPLGSPGVLKLQIPERMIANR